MKKIYLVKSLRIDTWDGNTLDDINTSLKAEIFNTLEEAQKYVKDDIENCIEDLTRGDEDDIEQFGSGDYSEKIINEMYATISTWTDFGEGCRIEWFIEEKEI